MEADWKTDLPEDLCIAVAQPHRFEYFEEPSAHAEKMLGYDKSGLCCYYRHAYALTRDVLDDEDNFYEEVAYREIVTAWLLENGQWLCCKSIKTGVGCSTVSAPRYELAHSRPR